MKKVKLTYFNGRGRAEVARLILSIAGEVFEDDRVEFSDWEALKPRKLFYQITVRPLIHSFKMLKNITIKDNIFIVDQRFGQLPRLDIDGETLYQSLAINRFLARKYGLAGRNAMEEANVDMIVDCINDAFEGSKYCSRCNF